MKKFSVCFILLLLCLVAVASAEPKAEVDIQTRSILITDEGTYQYGNIVKLILLAPDTTLEALDSEEVSATSAISYIKEVKAGVNKVSFPVFRLPVEAPYGTYQAYMICGETVTKTEVPYLSQQQLTDILSDTAKAEDFVWVLENFYQELPIAEADVERIRQLDDAGKSYFAANYILGNGFDSMDEATFRSIFGAKLTAYLTERVSMAVSSLNQAGTAIEIEKALTDYNDIFGINFTDSNWLGSLSENQRSSVYDRISRLMVATPAEVQTVLQEQIALQKIETGPWGNEESLLNRYATLLQLDLTVLNRLSDREKVYRALVGVEFLSGTELQQKLNELSVPTVVIPVQRPTGGGGGGGGGAINIKPNELKESVQENTSVSENQAQFSDLESVSWAKEAILSLQSAGVLNGKTKTLFCPSDSITRAEFAKMLVLAFSLNNTGKTVDFYDVSEEFWAKKYIDTAWENNIITGYNGRFLPNNNITREDMAVMIYRLKANSVTTISAPFADYEEISDYAKTAISYLYENKLVSGKGNNYFCPKQNATRAEAAVMLYNVLSIMK